MSKEKDKNDKSEETQETAALDNNVRAGYSGPLSVIMPPDPTVLSEARKLVADRGTRIEDLAVCTAQDPVIVIELLRTANAMFFSGGRAPITSARTATIRLGADVLLELFDKLKERKQIEDPEVAYWFEVHRSRSRRCSIIATILGEAITRNLSEECQVAALLQFVGEMVAVAFLEDDYVRLANEVSRGSINYRLVQDHKFDLERIGIAYLKRQGVPEGIAFVVDREARPRQADRFIMKPICQASAELLDAFDANRLEKFAPGKTLPAKSALRTLPLTDTQYLKVYERVAEFLFSFKLMEDKKKKAKLTADEAAAAPAPAATVTAEPVQPEVTPETASLDDEIRNLLATPNPTELDEGAAEVKEVPAPSTTKIVQETRSTLGDALKDFSLAPAKPGEVRVARVVEQSDPDERVAPPTIHTEKGSAYLSSITDLMGTAKSSEELLAEILGKMVKPNGPFEKAALIVVSKDRKSALVVAARGPNLGNGQRISLDDPLNPLAMCFSKVQSFSRSASKVSPFGSRSFAVAPIDADHDTPVALYADCGETRSLTFEARRIFRNVVDVLNQRLPELPGGIPNELS